MRLLTTGQAANPMGRVVSREKYCTSADILTLQLFWNKHWRWHCLGGSRSRLAVVRRRALQSRTLGFRDLPQCRQRFRRVV